jgi:hypothetical protein
LERKARLSHLALPEMLRLFFVFGLLSCRYRHGVNEGCPDRRPVTVSVSAVRIVREFHMTRQAAAMLSRLAQKLRQLGDIGRDPPCLIERERIRVLFWTSGGSIEKSASWLVDREHTETDHICLSCGKAMRLAGTIPEVGESPELRNYECKACGVVFIESVERAAWRESVGV